VFRIASKPDRILTLEKSTRTILWILTAWNCCGLSRPNTEFHGSQFDPSSHSRAKADSHGVCRIDLGFLVYFFFRRLQ
jgi:hypothetical protein